MYRLIPLLLVPIALGAPPPATNTIRLNGHNFTLPNGFTIELVAASPLVDRPIMADFDEEGRLYVADSSGSNDKPDVQLRERPHRIVRLDPAAADGIFHRSIEFADKMMFPEGVLWHNGSLYVGAPPSIWKLTDTTGGGAADTREEWFKGNTLTGCANDLHGPYLGPDGWIYWCKGAFAKQTHERPGREPIVTKAAHIFRARPDGSGLETVMTGGMDNPVEVAWSPSGERFFTTTFIQRPGGGNRDAIVHAIYGGVYGKENDAVNGHPRTSPNLMPVMTHLGPAAPSGLCRYESAGFGDDYRDNLFATLFNMRKVTRHVLVPDGATFKTIDSDFLVSDNFDFHPTDALEDADGSLLVIDTGGWYKLCCPTAQLAKPDVLGAIYRVRRIDAPKIDDPRGLTLDWANPKPEWLADPRPAVRKRAIAVLAKPQAIADLERVVRAGQSAEAKRNAIWALTRVDSVAARTGVRAGLLDSDDTVVVAALHSVSARRDALAAGECRRLVERKSLGVQRAAAEALGRIGDGSAIPALTNAMSVTQDPVLRHSLTFALIEIADVAKTTVALTHPSDEVRGAALIALDQMAGSKLDVRTVLNVQRQASSEWSRIRGWILSRHPEWGDQVLRMLESELEKANLIGPELDVKQLMICFASHPGMQELIAKGASMTKPQRGAVVTRFRKSAIDAMKEAKIKAIPESWVNVVSEALGSPDNSDSMSAIETLYGWQPSANLIERYVARLHAVAMPNTLKVELRLKALAVAAPFCHQLSRPGFEWLLERVQATEPAGTRSLAADLIARGSFSADQLKLLKDTLPTIGVMEIDRVLDAFAKSTDDQTGERLLQALAKRKQDLRVATLRPRFAKFSPAIRAQAEKLFQEIDVESAKQVERLEKMVANLKGGDIRRGQLVFNGQKAACSACHAVGYLGGTVGPDLTKIGSIRTERDLLESIVFPSASFVRGYEPVSVMTKRGVPVNGLLKRETPEEVEVTTSATETVRIPRDQVDSILPGTISIMPAGFDQQLTEQDFADLLAFLKTRR